MKFDNSFFSNYITFIKHVMPSIVYVPCLPKGDQSNVMLRKDVSSHIFYIAKNLCKSNSSTVYISLTRSTMLMIKGVCILRL